MANVNYYEWLELPVETCETDQAKLTATVEKKIAEWNGSKNMDIQSRASVHGQAIREVINNPTEWKQLYNDFKKATDAKINNWMESAVEDNSLPENQVAIIAQKCKVSESYVRNCAKVRGIVIGEAAETTAEATGISLNDIAPDKAVVTKLNTSQKFIVELGYADLFEWINDQVEGAAASAKSSKEDIENACDQIYNVWHKKQPKDNATSTKKSNNEKIATGFKKLLKDDSAPLETYQKYLVYVKVENILKDMSAKLKTLDKDYINENVFNHTVDDIYSVLGNRDNAKSILRSYCVDKNIATPKPAQNMKVCPFCHTSFSKKTGETFTACPVCNRSYLIKCPSCGKQKNLLDDLSCDGVDLQKYPYWEGLVKNASAYYEKLQFSSAIGILNDIESEWKGFDGIAALRSKCEAAQQDCGKQIKEVEALIEEGKYNKAASMIKKIGASYPSVTSRFPEVEDKLANAKKVLAQCRVQSDEDTKIAMLMQLAKEVTDDIEINTELQKYPVKEVRNLKAGIDTNSGRVVISWESDNKANSVSYIVVKKLGSRVANKEDGDVLNQTESMSISDSLNSAEVVYYGVYASRGTMNSSIAVTEEPVVFISSVKASLSGHDGGFDAVWTADSFDVIAYYSESKVTTYGEGIKIENITPTGLKVDGLINGKTYYVSFYRTLEVLGKKYYSPIKIEMITPMEQIAPPEISVALGNNPGEYRLKQTNSQDGFKLEFYYSTSQSAPIIQNSSTSMSTIQSNLIRLNFSTDGKNEYLVKVDENQKQLFAYPVIVRNDTAMVGEQIVLQFIRPLNVTNSVPSGNNYSIFIDKWPEGVDLIYLCYNNDQYPSNYRDCDGKTQIPKSEYESKGYLQVSNIKSQKYYITFFARKSGQIKPVPVGNLMLDCQKKVTVTFQFEMPVLFSKNISIRLKSTETNYIPELSFAVAQGAVPLEANSYNTVFSVPEQNDFRGEAVIKVTGFTPKKNDYGKLFCEVKGYKLVVCGPSKLA